MADLVGRERKCPVCGTIFIVYPDWVYRKGAGDGIKVFCSWGCMRSWETRETPKSRRREAIIQAIRDGLTVREIVNLLGVTTSAVVYWRNKMEEEEERNNER